MRGHHPDAQLAPSLPGTIPIPMYLNRHPSMEPTTREPPTLPHPK